MKKLVLVATLIVLASFVSVEAVTSAKTLAIAATTLMRGLPKDMSLVIVKSHQFNCYADDGQDYWTCVKWDGTPLAVKETSAQAVKRWLP